MIKDYTDYIDIVHEKFPELSTKAIKDVLKYGFKMYAYLNKSGCDVSLINKLKDQSFIAYTGAMPLKSDSRYVYRLKKWKVKEKTKAVLSQKKFDGYYYFGVPVEKGELILKDLKNRSVKYIHFENTTFTSIEKELYHDHSIDYIFKLKYPIFVGLNFKKVKYKYDKFLIEFVGINKESTWHRLKQQIPSTKD